MALSDNLIGFWKPAADHTIPDLSPTAGTALAAVGSATVTDLGGGSYEARDATGPKGWQIAAAAGHQPANSLSFMWHGQVFSDPTAETPALFGCYYNSDGASPYFSWGIWRDPNFPAAFKFGYNTAGSFRYIGHGTLSMSNSTVYMLVATYNHSTGELILYYNGGNASASTPGGTGGPTYGASPLISCGIRNTGDYYSNAGTRRAALWSRVLTSDEVSNLYSSPDAPIGDSGTTIRRRSVWL